MLRRIFGPNKEEVTGEWRKLHNEELSDPCSSPNVIRVIESRRTRRAGHVACRGKVDVYTEFWWGNLTERNHLKDPSVKREDIRLWDVWAWTGSIWLRIGTGGGHL